MLSIKVIEPDQADRLPEFNGPVYSSEDVMLRITRLGLSMSFLKSADSRPLYFDGLRGMAPESAARNGFRFIAAFDEDRCLGWAALEAGTDGWMKLDDVRVETGSRKNGIARQLIRSASAIAHQSGFAGIRACVPDDNAWACGFLQHVGFELMGMDRMLFSASLQEQMKPLQQRKCALFFYLPYSDQDERI